MAARHRPCAHIRAGSPGISCVNAWTFTFNRENRRAKQTSRTQGGSDPATPGHATVSNSLTPRVPKDWRDIERSPNACGHTAWPGLLDAEARAALAALDPQEDNFRLHIVRARHDLARGEYKSFASPLLARLRGRLHRHRVPVANRWDRALGMDVRHSDRHDAFPEPRHQTGQSRPPPLLLPYGAGDYNCRHQHLDGQHVFPLQIAVLLSNPRRDVSSGGFVMTESARSQQGAGVVPLREGDAMMLTVNQRPVPDKRGDTRRVAMRHGVRRIHSGKRHTLGLIFHDAR